MSKLINLAFALAALATAAPSMGAEASAYPAKGQRAKKQGADEVMSYVGQAEHRHRPGRGCGDAAPIHRPARRASSRCRARRCGGVR